MPIFRKNNVGIYYEQKDDGKPIVFLHGYTGSGRDWSNQIGVLSDDYMAIAVDHRGHGKSDAPRQEKDYSIQIFSEDVYSLLSELGIGQCCIVGHSMGGFMALQLILDYPDIVNALVLVDTSSGEFEMAPGSAELRAKLDDLARNEGLEAAFEYDVLNNPIKIDKFQKHPELREIARQKVINTSVDGYVYTARAFGKWQPVTDRLHEITVPVLIFLGEEDIGFFKASQILEESIENSELVKVPGVGHSPHEEAPELFNKSFLKFLSGLKW